MSREDFLMELVTRQALNGCSCQMEKRDFEINKHRPKCLVGQAQWYLGKEVTWEDHAGKTFPPPFPRLKTKNQNDKE